MVVRRPRPPIGTPTAELQVLRLRRMDGAMEGGTAYMIPSLSLPLPLPRGLSRRSGINSLCLHRRGGCLTYVLLGMGRSHHPEILGEGGARTTITQIMHGS